MTRSNEVTPIPKAPKPPKKRHADLPVGRGDCERRARSACEARCNDACTGRGNQAHHMLRRSHGGSDDASNLLWVCTSCHSHIHANPAVSYLRGWLVRGLGRSNAVRVIA